LAQQRVTEKALCVLCRQREFQLDFFGHGSVPRNIGCGIIPDPLAHKMTVKK
jgi:hypothetical protein